MKLGWPADGINGAENGRKEPSGQLTIAQPCIYSTNSPFLKMRCLDPDLAILSMAMQQKAGQC